MGGNQFYHFENVFNCLREGKANFQNWILQESDFKIIIVLRGNLAAELYLEGRGTLILYSFLGFLGLFVFFFK